MPWKSQERKAQQKKEWRRANPGKVKAQKQRYRAAHEEQTKANARRYNRSPAKRAANRKYNRAHPERLREGYERYRQRQAAHCRPLCIVLSRDPRVEAAARKLRPPSRPAPTPRQAPRQAPAPRRTPRRAPKRSREERLAARRLHYRQNRETMLAKQRACRRTDHHRAYIEKNRERLKANTRARYYEHLEE